MVDFAKLTAEREAYKAFLQTPLGILFSVYDHAVIEYWRNDSNERISDKRLSDLSEAERKARKAFVGRLMELGNG